MIKNVGSQFIGIQMVSSSDGTAFTGTTTIYVTGNAGTQAIGSVGSGICVSEGNGFHTYVPAQAETNYDHIGFTFIGTGAIPATIQVFTTFPQTVDNNVLAAGSTGFAAIKAETVLILEDTAEIGTAGVGLSNIGTIATCTTLTNTINAASIVASVSGNVDGTVASVVGAVGSVTGAVGSVTADVGITATAVDNILDETLTAHVTADSFAVAMKDTLADTADMQPRVAIIEIDTTTDIPGLISAVQSDTDNIQTRIPSALINGRMNSDVEAINDSTTAAVQLALSAAQIESGACEGTPSTTVVQTDLAETQDDIYIGRTVIFTSGNARGEASDITDYVGSTGTITVTTLANAPASSDTFILI